MALENRCQPCQQAVEVIRQAYQNAPPKVRGQALDKAYQAVSKVYTKNNCTSCPFARIQK